MAEVLIPMLAQLVIGIGILWLFVWLPLAILIHAVWR